MAKIILQLTLDPTTRKRELQIGYESDSDALPMEHDADHKAAVEKVIGKTTRISRVGGNQGTYEQATTPPVPQPIEQKG